MKKQSMRYDTYWDCEEMALAINPKQVETTHGVVNCGEITRSTCNRLINESTSSDNFKVAGRVLNKDTYEKNSEIREVNAFIIHEEKLWIDELVISLAETAMAFLDYNVVGLLERPQLLNYKQNSKGYDWHTDIGLGMASTRKISITVNLNDNYEGGNLQFFSDKTYDFNPPRGDAIAFPSFLPHRVTPITKGERWSLVAWIGGQPFR
tara:strand:- start:34 stop:657 length:624 start_codon:yes stop_codon:yes gene_type:complete